MLVIVVSSLYGNARAMRSHTTRASDRVSHPVVSTADQCPCTFPELTDPILQVEVIALERLPAEFRIMDVK